MQRMCTEYMSKTEHTEEQGLSNSNSSMQKCSHVGCFVYTAKQIEVGSSVHYTPETWNCGSHPEDHIIEKYEIRFEAEYVDPKTREMISELFDKFMNDVISHPDIRNHNITGGDQRNGVARYKDAGGIEK